jgi:hypothetical protein
MKFKTAWAIQSFCLCFLFNLAFAAVIFLMADKILGALNVWVSPLIGPGAPVPPEDLKMALGSFGTFVVQIRGYLIPVLAALTTAITLLLWFFLFLTGGRQISRATPKAAQGKIEVSTKPKEEGEEAR